jgi:hypothetical protein
VYNSSIYTLTEITLLIEVYRKDPNGVQGQDQWKKALKESRGSYELDKQIVLSRRYRETVFIEPGTAGRVIFNAGYTRKAGEKWGVRLEAAEGETEPAVNTGETY